MGIGGRRSAHPLLKSKLQALGDVVSVAFRSQLGNELATVGKATLNFQNPGSKTLRLPRAKRNKTSIETHTINNLCT